MRAELISLDMNSDIALEDYRPENSECFGFWLTATIGADSDSHKGADNFQIFICNQEWLEKEMNSERMELDRYLSIENGYDLNLISAAIKKSVANCEGDDWMGIVEQISKFGLWEFADYSF